MNVRRHLALVMLVAAASAGAATDSRAPVPAGTFETILPPAPGVKSATVPAFTMDRVPVTNADFARFVSTHPQWRRDRVARVFADAGYLQHWASDTAPASKRGARRMRSPQVKPPRLHAASHINPAPARRVPARVGPYP